MECRTRGVIVFAAHVSMAIMLPAAFAYGDQPGEATLHLKEAGVAAGELRGSDDPGAVRWQVPGFARPFEFALGHIDSVRFAPASPEPRSAGRFALETISDDTLFGELVDITSETIVFEAAGLGSVELFRQKIRRLYRRESSEVLGDPSTVQAIPAGDTVWLDSSSEPRWQHLASVPTTETPGAAILSDFAIPDTASIELALSWKERADFVFAIGTDREANRTPLSYSFEVWGNDIVAIAESQRDADFAQLVSVQPGPGRLQLRAYLDQRNQRLRIYSSQGQQLADLRIRYGTSTPRSGLRLTNGKGDLRLENFRITGWDGEPPRQVTSSSARIHRAEGPIVYGSLISYDQRSQLLSLNDGGATTEISLDRVTDIYLNVPEEPASTADSPAAVESRQLRAVYQDGTRLVGEPIKYQASYLWLRSPIAAEPLRLPIRGLQSLAVLQANEVPAESAPAGRLGRLEMPGVELPGWLASVESADGKRRLAWHPQASQNESPLLPTASGRIDFRKRAKQRAARPGIRFERLVIRARNGRKPIGIAQVIAQPPGDRRTVTPPLLHLKTGDTIPVAVQSIDADGIQLTSPVTDTRYVPHTAIKALELNGKRDLLELKAVDRARLLTLPRQRRDSPPTHLICSRNGDFLRGQIRSLDQKTLVMDVRLETQRIPRSRIAHIIWLHADELDESGSTATTDGGGDSLQVQAVHTNGNRLTFLAEQELDGRVSGSSPVLGPCSAALHELDELLLGSYVAQAAAELTFHAWRLQHAIDPKYVNADDGGRPGGTSGTMSPLVGQPAPDFQLPLLGEGQFHLAESSGRIVVLDFWASWCVPCLESMPLVAAVTSEFAEQGVELVAINLEQRPAQITAMLEREQWKMPVALDRDGRVAAQYAVQAIPQTVVVDRDGRIARLFVGGGAAIEAELRTALEELSAQ